MAASATVPTRLRVADRAALGFAAVVIAVAAASSNDPSTHGSPRDLDAFAVLLLGAALAATLASRRLPASVALAVLVAGFVWYGVGYTSGLVNVATLVAYYQLGASEAPRRKWAVTVLSVLAVVVNIGVLADAGWPDALTAAGYLVMAVLFGELVRHRRLLLEQYARRAEQAEADAHRRVVEERLRIARDLHDVLAHSVSAMVVQASVAADRLDGDPAGTRDALRSIREAGRQAMGEVQATVAVLRAAPHEGTPAATAPAPRIDRISELVDAVRARGVSVEVATALSGRPLPELVELTAYRVVQEGLTNVVRHARASTAEVTIAEEPGCLVVEVRDDGDGGHEAGHEDRHEGGAPAVPGFGLRGMAERVESIGGELWHGRDGSPGWAVRASLPLAGARP